jgi:hypothetical protein
MSESACCIVVVGKNNDKRRKYWYLSSSRVSRPREAALLTLSEQEENQHEYTDLSDANRVVCDVVVVGVEQV